MKADQERVSKLLTDTVTLLCKNGLIYSQEIKVQGLLGITLDKNDVFIVHINETIGGGVGKDSSPSDGGRKRGTTAPPGGANYVDLTRVADTPMTTLGSLQGMSMTPGGRKQRPPMMMPPHLIPRGAGAGMQYMNPGMPRMRMNNAGMHSAAQLGNQMMYAQRGGQPMMIPGMRGGYGGGRGVGPGSRPRQHLQMLPVAVSAINDDEDVMIVGTGHEDVNAAARRATSHPPHARRRQIASTSVGPGSMTRPPLMNTGPGGSSSGILRNQATPNGSGPGTDTSATTGEGGSVLRKQIVIQPSVLGEGVGSLEADEPSTGDYQPEFVLLNSIGGVSFDGGVEDGSDGETSTQKKSIGVEVETDKDALPVVYTDVAEAGLSGLRVSLNISAALSTSTVNANQDESSTSMDIEAPGFDILTAEDETSSTAAVYQASIGTNFSTWTCCSPGCTATFVDATRLASHYTAQHSGSEVDLAPPPGTVMPPDEITSYHSSSGSQPGSVSGDSDRGVSYSHKALMLCPDNGCERRFSSYPGLYMHLKKVHCRILTKSERRELRKKYGRVGIYCANSSPLTETVGSSDMQQDHHNVQEKNCETELLSGYQLDLNNEHIEADEGDSASVGAEVDGGKKKNFLCLFSRCEVSCSSREKLVEHLQSCHSSMDMDGGGGGFDAAGTSSVLKEEEAESSSN